MVAIGTSRDRTLQAGKLFWIDLNGSETNSTGDRPDAARPGRPRRLARRHRPLLRRRGSGRHRRRGKFLVSWADGPVESELLALGEHQRPLRHLPVRQQTRRPATRSSTTRHVGRDGPPAARAPEPPRTPVTPVSPLSTADTTIGALNVYDSSLGDIKANLTPGSVVKVRLLEGFSAEEGFADMFGLTEFDGQSRYGEVPVYADGSFAAKVPANVPLHMQLIDKFAMSMANEAIWISGRARRAALLRRLPREPGQEHDHRPRAAPRRSSAAPSTWRRPPRARPRRQLRRNFQRSATRRSAACPGTWPSSRSSTPSASAATTATRQAGQPQLHRRRPHLGTMQTFTFDLRGQTVPLMVGERATTTSPPRTCR